MVGEGAGSFIKPIPRIALDADIRRTLGAFRGDPPTPGASPASFGAASAVQISFAQRPRLRRFSYCRARRERQSHDPRS